MGAMAAATVHLLQPLAAEVTARRRTRDDEVEEVQTLLLAHADPAAGTAAEAACVAEIVAVACLGDQHLWQDLQLASRAELSAMMRHWFPALVERNHLDMKWKKFLYKQLCEREALYICKAPSCMQCSDRGLCFGHEA
ncbi:MAG TPA: nitrogen fixation protein NifQ [Rubrivivax sp.]|jgi:nitrogen fixation protein NifQ|nr:nitrogen fixation protein NifQ [Rubrivivax sp.]